MLAYSITPLPGLSGQEIATVFDLNAHGAACGHVHPNAQPQNPSGAIWPATGQLPVSISSSTASGLASINDAGVAVGVVNAGTLSRRACKFSAGGTSIPLTMTTPSDAQDINNSGVAVVNISSSAGHLDPATNVVTWLYPLSGYSPGTFSADASAINDAGDVAGRSSVGNFHRAVFWENGNAVARDLGPCAYVNGMNASRQIVGSIEVGIGQYYPMIWDASGAGAHAHLLSLPPQMDGAELYAINDAGVAVGTGWTTSPNNLHTYAAFLYENGAWRNLNDLIRRHSGWHLDVAQSINASGQIACTGRYGGDQGSVILTPVNVFDVDTSSMARIFGVLAEGIAADFNTLDVPRAEAHALAYPADTPAALLRRDVLTALAIEVLASRLVDERARERLRHAALDAILRSTERLRSLVERGTLPPDDSSR